MKKGALSLTGVLIILGIIAVICAMTIPTLIQKYNAKSFERKFEEALAIMNTRQTSGGYKTTKSFVNELSKSFKINKICERVTDCFADTVYWDVIDVSVNSNAYDAIDISKVTTAADLGQKDWDSEAVGVQFANGITGIIAYNPVCKLDAYSNQIKMTNCLALVYDISGLKKPNTYGKDIKSINAKLGKCAFKSGNICFGKPFRPYSLTIEECNELGLAGVCVYNDDYWAGAVDICEGANKLPQAEQLANIANYVYNKTNISADTDASGLSLDTDRVRKLGFSVRKGDKAFSIWSGQSSGGDVVTRHFNSSETEHSKDTRDDKAAQTMCIIN